MSLVSSIPVLGLERVCPRKGCLWPRIFFLSPCVLDSTSEKYITIFNLRKASGNAFVSGAGGLRFKSRAGQIGHSVANGSSPCDISSKGAVLPRRNDVEIGPANSLHASAYYSEYQERFDYKQILSTKRR